MQFLAFDEAYLQRLRSADFRTEQHFVSYFSQLIQLKLRSRVHSGEMVDDLKQEIFARVFAVLRSQEGIRHADRLGAFVNSVCNNVLLEYYRSSSRAGSLHESSEEMEIPDRKTDVLTEIVSQQTARNVRATLDELSERDRRLLKAVFLDEQDKDEVCRDFQVDRSYLRVLVHRAKRTFKSHFIKAVGGEQRSKVASG